MPTYNLNDIVSNESHAVSVVNSDTYHTLIPLYGPFFKDSINLVHISSSGVVTPQIAGVDFNFALMWISASRVLNDILYGAVTIQTPKDNGYYRFNSYKTAGSQWNIPVNQVYAFLVNNSYNPRIASWEQVVGEPALYPPTAHTQPLTDFKGFDEFILAIDRMANHIMSSPALSGHAMDPDAHGMMKANNVEIGVAVDDVINNRPITSTIADKVITLRHLKQFIEESGMLAPDAIGAVSVQDLVNHSNSTTTHNDIRLLIAALTNSTTNSVSVLTSNLNNHTTAVDPHPQYMSSTEVDSKISSHDVANVSHSDIRQALATLDSSTSKVIAGDYTVHVKHTPNVNNSNEFSTLQEAWEYLKGKYVLGRTTIQIEAGAYTLKTTILRGNLSTPKWSDNPDLLLRESIHNSVYITGGNGVLSSEVVMTHDCDGFNRVFVHHEHTSIIYNGITFIGTRPIGTDVGLSDIGLPFTDRVLQFNNSYVRFGDKGANFFSDDEKFSVSVVGGRDGVGYHMSECWGGRIEIKDYIVCGSIQGSSRVHYDYLSIKGMQLTNNFYNHIGGYTEWVRGDTTNYTSYNSIDTPLEGKINTSVMSVYVHGGVFSTKAIKTKNTQYGLIAYDNGYIYLEGSPLKGNMDGMYPTVVSEIEAERYVFHATNSGVIWIGGSQWAYSTNRKLNLPTNNPITLPKNKIKCGVGGIVFNPASGGSITVSDRWEIDIHRNNEIPGYISVTSGKTSIADANKGGTLYMGMESTISDAIHNNNPANINNQLSTVNISVTIANPLNFKRTYRDWLKTMGTVLGKRGSFRDDNTNTFISMHWAYSEAVDDTTVLYGDPSDIDRTNPTLGYVKLNNGLIMQWHKFIEVPQNTGCNVTFPIAFPNACLAVCPVPLQGYANVLSVSSITQFGCVIDNFSDSNVELEQANYIAFGF